MTFYKSLSERVTFEPIDREDSSTGTRLKYEAGMMELLLLGKLLQPIIVHSSIYSWQQSLEGIDTHITAEEVGFRVLNV
jgi:hypothetical protein